MPRFDTLSWHQTIISELCMPQSPSLPRVIGAWDNADGIMIVMEGFESNAVHLMQTDDPLPVLRDVCRGLADLHDAGIAHRDVKLNNILLRKGRAYLCDFGLASSIYSPVTDESQLCTFVTRAPEIWASLPHSFAADMWSLGCVGYTIASGNHIMGFNAESLPRREIVDHLRSFAKTGVRAAKTLASFYFFAKCLQFDSTLRPTSRDLLSNLADGRRRRVLRKRPPTVTPPPLKLVKSMTFPMQTYLCGQPFVGRPESRLFLTQSGRREELLAIRDAICLTSFKSLIVTVDIFDRLPHKSTRTRICLATYIGGLTLNYGNTLHEISMTLWEDPPEDMGELFLPALASLGWKFESTYTLLESMNLHEDSDAQRKILSAYLKWPDSRTREDMVREALSAEAEEW